MRWLLHWIVSALVLLLVSRFVPGFHIRSFGSAMFAAAIVGLVNATLGLFLKVVTFPLAILTLGLFIFVIDAFMLLFASKLVPGFFVDGFRPAFLAAIVLALIHMLLGFITSKTTRW